MAGDAIACGRKVRTSRYQVSVGPNVQCAEFPRDPKARQRHENSSGPLPHARTPLQA